MVTKDNRRWPAGLHDTPARFGKLLDISSFDATFFSVHGKQAQVGSARTDNQKLTSVLPDQKKNPAVQKGTLRHRNVDWDRALKQGQLSSADRTLLCLPPGQLHCMFVGVRGGVGVHGGGVMCDYL